jgi:hypothetical protein
MATKYKFSILYAALLYSVRVGVVYINNLSVACTKFKFLFLWLIKAKLFIPCPKKQGIF